MNFWRIFFVIFTYIFGHRDLDLWPKVTNFNRVRASVVSNHLAKTASKSVHPFGWNFVHKNSGHTHTHTHTHRHTDTQTNCNENKTSPRFRGNVKKYAENYFHDFPSKKITRFHSVLLTRCVILKIRNNQVATGNGDHTQYIWKDDKSWNLSDHLGNWQSTCLSDLKSHDDLHRTD